MQRKLYTVSTRFATVCLRLTLSAAVLALTSSPAAGNQGGAGWLRVSTTDEEFSILMPSRPVVHVSGNFAYKQNGELVKARRVASVYAEGATFIVQMHEASNPKRLLKDYLGNIRVSDAPMSDFAVGSFAGKEQVTSEKDFHRITRYFTTKKRLYVIDVAKRDGSNPAVQRFLSSLGVGSSESDADPAMGDNASNTGQTPSTAGDPEQALKLSEVSKKAVLLWKPEPGFTEEARRNNITGSLRLRAVLSASGKVNNIQVVKGLGDGLTERAIYAARHISFLPAEKDGRPVSQWIILEYNFNIY